MEIILIMIVVIILFAILSVVFWYIFNNKKSAKNASEKIIEKKSMSNQSSQRQSQNLSNIEKPAAKKPDAPKVNRQIMSEEEQQKIIEKLKREKGIGTKKDTFNKPNIENSNTKINQNKNESEIKMLDEEITNSIEMSGNSNLDKDNNITKEEMDTDNKAKNDYSVMQELNDIEENEKEEIKEKILNNIFDNKKVIGEKKSDEITYDDIQEVLEEEFNEKDNFKGNVSGFEHDENNYDNQNEIENEILAGIEREESAVDNLNMEDDQLVQDVYEGNDEKKEQEEQILNSEINSVNEEIPEIISESINTEGNNEEYSSKEEKIDAKADKKTDEIEYDSDEELIEKLNEKLNAKIDKKIDEKKDENIGEKDLNLNTKSDVEKIIDNIPKAEIKEEKQDNKEESSKARILVVDDARFMRKMIRNILENAGHEVIAEGENGREAIELAGKLKPDLMTMDVTMPDVNGITALEEILKNDPNMKVIMVSAVNQQDTVTKALKLGAVDFIGKPFKEDNVLKVVNGVLSRYKVKS